MRIYAVITTLLFSVLQAWADPTIVFISGEYEYDSRTTFPTFARQLTAYYAVKTVLFERPEDPKAQEIPGLEQLEKADLIVMMIRRMVLPEEQLNRFKKYCASGKPIVALRTASHSFENWKEFDASVLGGNYQNHYGNDFKTTVTVVPELRESQLLRGVTNFVSQGSLYKNMPLREGTKVFLRGSIEGSPSEPVAWTHSYGDSRVFYTSLGHPKDFQEPSFQALLQNAIDWALDRPLEKRDK